MRFNTIAIMRRFGLRRFLQAVAHLPSFFKLFSRLAKDPRVSLRAKLLLVLILVYVLVPSDLLPDFFLGLGELDDLIVAFLGLRLFLRLCPPDVVQQHVHMIAAGQ